MKYSLHILFQIFSLQQVSIQMQVYSIGASFYIDNVKDVESRVPSAVGIGVCALLVECYIQVVKLT